ncbi:MAG: nickel-dependent hydrogenase large subunit [Dehalococcoidia bacterium]
MTRIAIDPITRIEGHLRIEVEVQDGNVADAWSSGTMFRGLEMILKGRDPRDAWMFAQRACGVCTTVHALASVRAVENALGITIPENARLVRNIIAGTQFIHDHVIHFYHLHALDWVDVVSATKADPARTSALAQSISNWPKSSTEYFQGILERLNAFVGSGQLGPFANGYWGHSAYHLEPEANLLAVAHYLEALEWQRDIVRIHAVLGGKNPHPQTYVVGGMALRMAPDAPTGLNTTSMAQIKQMLANARTFVEQVLIPDVTLVAGAYKEWFSLGQGIGNYMAYGDFSDSTGDPSTHAFPGGRVMTRDVGRVEAVDQAQISESVAHSYYEYDGDDSTGKHPWSGQTSPNYAGPNPPFETLEGYERYSWLKSPRYDGAAMEVGPLARMLVAYAAKQPEVVNAVDGFLAGLSLGPADLMSTMGRIGARALETQLLLPHLESWIGALDDNMNSGRLAIADSSKWKPDSWPKQVQGVGFEEAPRGALGHWVVIEDGKIANYQLVVPSTWNGSPRDGTGTRGAWEEALLNTPIADPDRPVEVLRTVHSFDPCMACAVHVYDPAGGSSVNIRVI